jgi:hypothetical protein
VQGFVLLHLASLGLRVLSFRRWCGLLVGKPNAKPIRDDETASRHREQAERTAGLVRKAARYALLRVRCLEQSLVLGRLLRQQRISATLRLGVCRAQGVVKAHAWVEHDGVPLAEDSNVCRDFHPFKVPLHGDLV